jgi:hypothetical protein
MSARAASLATRLILHPSSLILAPVAAGASRVTRAGMRDEGRRMTGSGMTESKDEE